MRNRLLQITRSVIAYLPELKPYTGSVVGCLLMQQMDFWFNQKPDGFYKFLSPASEHPDYRDGDSWTEELAISEAEFRTAADKICHRWPSKSAFDAADDKFQGKFYCSVYDRRRQLTTYFRNHPLVDACLDELAERNVTRVSSNESLTRRYEISRERGSDRQFTRQNGPQAPVFPVNQEPSATGSEEIQLPVNQDSSFTGNAHDLVTADSPPEATGTEPEPVPVGEESPSEEMSKPEFQQAQKTSLPNETKKTGSKTSKQLQPENRGCSSSDGLVFPESLTQTERIAVESMLSGCPLAYRQDVLDEIAGYKRAGTIRSSVIALTRQLIEAVKAGSFSLNVGAAVKDARESAAGMARRFAAATSMQIDPSTLSMDTINKLPPALRAKTLASIGRAE
ncbi:hypothetical protein [Cupriavidus basilensis]|uniref:Uncharacterized protein n=1 Tax=Cupriavidus basilensis TaxID=68895 RepID=A0A643FSM0_9BURK|nr:hypothetical protein [Cupriavidus basilensis]QOT82244.1 hypothetical protein F7R26_039740 [Cupriavidus basilensis]